MLSNYGRMYGGLYFLLSISFLDGRYCFCFFVFCFGGVGGTFTFGKGGSTMMHWYCVCNDR